MSIRILIVNAVALNAGDAAILEGELRALRAAYGDDAEITVSDDDPASASRLYPNIPFVAGFRDGRRRGLSRFERLGRSVLRRWRTAALRVLSHAPELARLLLDARAREQLDRIRAADVVVATGGTYLVEHYPLRPRIEELRAAQALGKPTYLYTQSLGPFRHPESRRIVGPVLRGASHIFLRDEASRRHVLELGIPASGTTVCPDAAFVLADVQVEATASSSTQSRGEIGASLSAGGETRNPRSTAADPASNERPSLVADVAAGPLGASARRSTLRVAVSVREWRRFRKRDPEQGLRAYEEAVAGTVRLLHERGAEVTFISTCQGVEEYWTDDSRFAAALVERHLSDLERVAVDTRFRRPEQLVEHLHGFDLAIATRMHFAILALCAGVPVVPIAYEFKTTELFADLGMEEMVEEIETIAVESLHARVCDALDSLTALRLRCAAALPVLRDSAAEPARRIYAEHPPHTDGSGR